jgi:hypothetical protein
MSSLEVNKEGKSIKMSVGFWYDEATDSIHMASDVEGFHVSITDTEGSKRCHKTLHKRLKALLQEHGKWPDNK